jgi:hypothetical protein
MIIARIVAIFILPFLFYSPGGFPPMQVPEDDVEDEKAEEDERDRDSYVGCCRIQERAGRFCFVEVHTLAQQISV